MMHMRKKAFTLIELFVVVGILSFLCLGIVSSFFSGLKLWQRIYAADTPGYGVALGLERFIQDVSECVPSAVMPFKGTRESVACAVASGLSLEEIAYEFYPESGSFVRKTRDCKAVLNEEAYASQREIFGDANVALRYLSYDEESQSYVWEEEWESSDSIPCGIQIEVTGDNDTIQKTIMLFCS